MIKLYLKTLFKEPILKKKIFQKTKHEEPENEFLCQGHHYNEVSLIEV